MLVRGTTPVERTAFDYGRRHRLDIQRLELVALEHPKFAERAVGIISEAVAEIVLTPA